MSTPAPKPARTLAATRRRRRLWLLLLAGLGLGSATALTLAAFQDNLVFFHSPSDIAAKPPRPGQAIRIGGLVEAGSVARGEAGHEIRFRITDGAHEVPVVYQGVLPDLFREGQGVVANGALDPSGVFRAREILARHDETYMPPEVADALKRSGHWQYGEPPPPAASWNTLEPGRAPRPGS
ncbi:MAG: cytochrome c maturation protein CcmE [Acetobacteraceae bacterium]|nr:cytochrome c maturation protein CcmE [Acetobacteraceae bacterium]